MEVLVRSGLGQGSYAFFSTWIVTATARKTLRHFGPNWQGISLSFLSSFSIMLIFPITIHAILHTPDVVEAILPGLIWGSIYIALVIRINLKKTKLDATIDAS